jgi:hypothetical protein
VPTNRQVRRTDRAVAAGLAVVTFGGLVAVIAVRGAEGSDLDGAAPTTVDGLTRADLDDYAAQLAGEQARLTAYRDRLRAIAEELGDESMLSGLAPADTAGWRPSEDPDTTTYGS